VSSFGYNYYITFVDTFTKYTLIYFLKSKADALKAFSQFLALIQNQFQSTIKALQSDWGGENFVHLPTCSLTLEYNTDSPVHTLHIKMGLLKESIDKLWR
jgi:hypothetical protein